MFAVPEEYYPVHFAKALLCVQAQFTNGLNFLVSSLWRLGARDAPHHRPSLSTRPLSIAHSYNSALTLSWPVIVLHYCACFVCGKTARSKRMKEAKKEAEALTNAFRAEKEAAYQASMQKVSHGYDRTHILCSVGMTTLNSSVCNVLEIALCYMPPLL